MNYYSFDGDYWQSHDTLKEAILYAEESIRIAREYCDPEWPDWVEHIRVVYSDLLPNDDTELFEETAIDIATVTQTNITYPDEGEEMDCDYYCDYRVVLVE